ncbi:MAG: hypothetical protein FWH31_05670 [Streptococcaceae bacterium]|nr:hypothetical protein [Streptococcaceae bacterium]
MQALAVKQTDSGATKLRRPFAERRAKHVARMDSGARTCFDKKSLSALTD